MPAFPDARIVPDLDALLALDDLDLIVLATPSGLHAEQARAVVEAGLPVVVDKPLGVDASEALAVVDAARQAGVPLTVFQNRRYDAEHATMRDVVRSGQLGEVFRPRCGGNAGGPRPRTAGANAPTVLGRGPPAFHRISARNTSPQLSRSGPRRAMGVLRVVAAVLEHGVGDARLPGGVDDGERLTGVRHPALCATTTGRGPRGPARRAARSAWPAR